LLFFFLPQRIELKQKFLLVVSYILCNLNL
jgi:hypothetical protein